MDKHCERLQAALDMRGMRPSTLSYKTGISEASISHYLKGHYEPKHDKMQLLAEALRVSAAWLSGFDVPMLEIKPSEEEVKKSPSEDEENLREYVIYHRDGKTRRVKFTPEQQRIFYALVEAVNAEQSKED